MKTKLFAAITVVHVDRILEGKSIEIDQRYDRFEKIRET